MGEKDTAVGLSSDTGAKPGESHPKGEGWQTSTSGLPTPDELTYMTAVLRRANRANTKMLDDHIKTSRRARDKDDWRFMKFKSELMYHSDVDKLSGRRSSTATKRARAALNDHVDFMNKAYGLNMEYPEFIEVGDKIEGSPPTVFNMPTDRQRQKVVGAGRLATPEDIEEL